MRGIPVAIFIIFSFIGHCYSQFQLDSSPVAITTETAFSRGTASAKLALADSLFRFKQYTQSFELYNDLLHHKFYSPSMLLKLAYIQEGLGHVGQSLYYLNLYHLATNDPYTLTKIREVADKNNLEGYSQSDASVFTSSLKNYHIYFIALQASICLLLFAWMFYQKIKQQRKPILPLVLLLFFAVQLVAYMIITSPNEHSIVANNTTYLMSGPSAGSDVVSIIGEGHLLEILGHNDVWVKIDWNGREAFVKNSELLPIAL